MKLDKQLLLEKARELLREEALNFVSEAEALSPEAAGIKLFEDPIVAVASADDPLFEKLKEEGVVGPHYVGPKEWMAEAKCVVSFFLPYSEDVKKANRPAWDGNPPPQMVHGRVQGQKAINSWADKLTEYVRSLGFKTLIPMEDKRFEQYLTPKEEGAKCFTSNWSERHTAYICGLGTFGAAAHIITEKGASGRLASFITDAELEIDERAYTGLYDYCTHCGACMRRCPGTAICMEASKEHTKCAGALMHVVEKYGTFICAKCQTGVPCESRIPAKIQK